MPVQLNGETVDPPEKTTPCPACGRSARFDFGTGSLIGSPFEDMDVEAVEYYSCPCGRDVERLIRPDGSIHSVQTTPDDE